MPDTGTSIEDTCAQAIAAMSEAVTALPSEARAALAALDQATATLLSERTDGAELAIAAANATSRMGEAVTCADGFGTGRLLGWAEAFDIVRLIATLVVAGVVVPLVVLSGAIAALPVASPRLSERLPTRLRCIACQVRLHGAHVGAIFAWASLGVACVCMVLLSDACHLLSLVANDALATPPNPNACAWLPPIVDHCVSNATATLDATLAADPFAAAALSRSSAPLAAALAALPSAGGAGGGCCAATGDALSLAETALRALNATAAANVSNATSIERATIGAALADALAAAAAAAELTAEMEAADAAVAARVAAVAEMRGAAGVIDDAFACEWVAAAHAAVDDAMCTQLLPRWVALAWACCGVGLLLMLDAAQGRTAVQPRCAHSSKVADEAAELEAANRRAAEELPAYAKGESFADAAPAYTRGPSSAELLSASIGKPLGAGAEPSRSRNTVQLQVHTDWRARVLQEQSFDPRSPVKSLCSSPTRQSQKRMVKDAWGSRNALAKGAALGATPTRYDRRASNSSPGRRASQSPGFRVVG